MLPDFSKPLECLLCSGLTTFFLSLALLIFRGLTLCELLVFNCFVMAKASVVLDPSDSELSVRCHHATVTFDFLCCPISCVCFGIVEKGKVQLKSSAHIIQVYSDIRTTGQVNGV